MALLLSIKLNAWVFRKRAQRLLVEMRSLEAGRSTSGEVQQLMGQWKGYTKDCNSEFCDYTVTLDNCWRSFRLCRALGKLSFTPMADAWLDLRVRNDILEQAHFHFDVYVPAGDFPEATGPGDRNSRQLADGPDLGYTLISSANTGREIGKFVYPAGIDPHPEYSVDGPTTCVGCTGIRTSYAPDVPTTTKEKLTSFNFSCATRWSPCTKDDDIMPGMRSELERESSLLKPTR